ncbi:MAG: hypothetical protein RL329_329, partial [Bacteroidota bacterium]
MNRILDKIPFYAINQQTIWKTMQPLNPLHWVFTQLFNHSDKPKPIAPNLFHIKPSHKPMRTFAFTCLAWMLAAQTVAAQCSTFYQFKNPTLLTGTAGQVGAVYKFSNVASGTDAHAEIVTMNNATLVHADVSNPPGYDAAWQPVVAASSGGYIDWKITFKQTNTNTDVTVNCVSSTAVSLDGDGSAMQKYVQTTGHIGNFTATGSTVGVTNPTVGTVKATGQLAISGGISITNRPLLFQADFANTAFISWRTGVTSATNADNATFCFYFIPLVTCDNVTNAGTISGTQTICANGQPTPLQSTLTAVGGSGNLEYQWMKNTTGLGTYTLANAAQWAALSAATNPDYTPSTLTATSGYVRLARRSGCSSADWQPSNVVVVTVSGAVSVRIKRPNSILCKELPFLIEATTGGSTYTWDFGAGAEPRTATGKGPISVVYGDCSEHPIRLVVTTASCTIVLQDTLSTTDTQIPTIVGVPADASVLCNAVPTAPTLSAFDNCGQPTIQFTEQSDKTTNGSCTDNNYTLRRVWKATDQCGNIEYKTQFVRVSDTGHICLPNAGIIGGKVFVDNNFNGVDDEGGAGVEGVTVQIYEATATGSGLVNTATTIAGGYYQFTGMSPTKTYRLEFTIPTGKKPGGKGLHSGTLVQFTHAGKCSNDLGIGDLSQYCEAAPSLIVPCYSFGSAEGNKTDALVSFPVNNNAPSSSDGLINGSVRHLATYEQIGATFGVAYKKSTGDIFASAFVKRHSGLGPGGTGAIYKVNINGIAPPTVWADMNALFGANTTGPNPHAFGNTVTCPDSGTGMSNFACWFNDINTYDAVGKVGIGDIDISDDGEKLYVLNAYNKKLYELETGNPSAGTARIWNFPAGSVSPTCSNGSGNVANSVRPFAVKYRNGKVYVGASCELGTCFGCGGGAKVYVFELNPNTGTWKQVLYANMQRGGSSLSAYWFPWQPYVNPDTSAYAYVNNVHLLFSDIEFDGNDMLIGLRDMAGDQFGHMAGKPIAGDQTLLSYESQGDIYRAAYNPNTGLYDMEINGTSGGVTTAGANSGYGLPSNGTAGQYYYGNRSNITPSASFGTLAVLPSKDRIYTPGYDFLTVYSQGVFALDNNTGARVENYNLIPNTVASGQFGKANGFGDIEVGCADAPNEIGNYVWKDLNGNGVQDPNEAGLAGIKVTLFNAACDSLATVITDVNGQYYFNNNVLNGSYLLPNTNYYLVFGTDNQYRNGFLFDSLSVTATNAATGANADEIDSDGTTTGGLACFNGKPFIAVMTGGPGTMQHHYDIGFTTCPAPKLENLPLSASVRCDSVPAPADVRATSACDNNVSLVYTQTRTNGICSNRYTLTRKWVATDRNNRITTGIQVLTVLDTMPPVILNVPASITVRCDSVPTAPILTATDCGANPNIVYTQTSTKTNNNSCYDQNYTLTRKWVATDACGLKTTKIQIITVLDTIEPILTIPADVTVSCEAIPVAGTPTFTDNCGVAATARFTQRYSTCSNTNLQQNPGFEQTNGQSFSQNFEGYPARTLQNNSGTIPGWGMGYTCPNNNCGAGLWVYDNNNTINNPEGDRFIWLGGTIGGYCVVSKTALSLGNNECVEICFDAAAWTTKGSSPTPVAQSPAYVSIEVERNGIYFATVYAQWLPTSNSFTDLNWQNICYTWNAPSAGTYKFYITADNNVTGNPNAGMTLDNVVTRKCCSTNPNPTAGCADYQIFRTWSIADKCGNTVARTQTITVKDTTKPVLTGIPADVTVAGTLPTIPEIGVGGVHATDNCDPNPRITLTETRDSGCVYHVYRTWTATDTCGNKDTKTQVITVNTGTADAGVLTIANGTVCLPNGIISATQTTNPTLPIGYVINYLLADSSGVIVQKSTTPSFTVTTAGVYKIYGFIYNNTVSDVNYFNINLIQLGTTRMDALNTLANGKCIVVSGTGAEARVQWCNGSIGDFVWEDLDGDGIQDPNEPGIGGVRIELTGTDINGNPVTRTVTTNADGSYEITALLPGTYTIKFITPTGYVFTYPNQGGDDTKDSDADRTTGQVTITLGSGEINRTIDAGLINTANTKIGDYVWIDADANGVQDGSEVGKAGVTVTLTGTTGNGTPVTLTTTTGTNGQYLFENLFPGTYTVKFDLPTGFSFTPKDSGGDDAKDSDADIVTGVTTSITLVSGQPNLSIDAGLIDLNTKIGDFVWEDLNGNGIQDPNESGIGGVRVELTGTDIHGNPVTRTVTTNADGSYSITGLLPGTYIIKFITPTGYVFTYPNQGSDDAKDSDADRTTGQVTVVLRPGETNLTIDAGLINAANTKIGDYVWIDLNGNGLQDSNETGKSGVTVTLTGTTGNGTPVTLTATTDANGKYLFENLFPGTYTVKFDLPTGFGFTYKDQGSDDAKDSDANVTTGITAPITLVSGQPNWTIDAGIIDLANTKIGDYVWEDLNGNGIQDVGETGIPNITVKLTGTTGNGTAVTLTTTTDANGKYLFENLTPGDYTITFVRPAGFEFTSKDRGGDDSKDSDADVTTGETIRENLVSGETNLTYDAGMVRSTTLGDLAFLDCNNNGMQDGGEAGLENVTVTLSGIDGAGNSITRTTTTNASGLYQFSNVLPGRYVLTFGMPTGIANLVYASKNAGTNRAIDSDVDNTGKTDSITIWSGISNDSIDAGFKDVTAPIVIRPAQDTTVECDGSGNRTALQAWLANHGGAIVRDNRALTVTWTNDFTTLSNECGETGTATVIFTVVDDCGNRTQTTAKFTVRDAVKPILTNIPTDITVACSAIPTAGTPIATDNCDNNVNITYRQDTTRSNAGCADSYILTRTWTATDACGNTQTATQKVTVEDRTAPTLWEVPANVTVECNQLPVVATPRAIDDCDNNVTLTYNQTRTDGTGNCADRYTLTRTWVATDNCGNSISSVQVITVEDRVAPVLAGIPANVTVECHQLPTVAEPTATDNCDNQVAITYNQTRANGTGNCADSYTLTRTWTATDNCGNSTTGVQTITVEDRTAPVLAGVPANTTVECNLLPEVARPTATDNCDADITITYNQTRANGTGNCADSYTLTRTWVATDNCGNTTTGVQIITVEDRTAPVLAGVPANVTVEC